MYQQDGKEWIVVHLGRGLLVSLQKLQDTFQLCSLWHAANCVDEKVKKTPLVKKLLKHLTQGFVRSIRHLLWPGVTFTTMNAYKKGQNRPPFHRMRVEMAEGVFIISCLYHIYYTYYVFCFQFWLQLMQFFIIP